MRKLFTVIAIVASVGTTLAQNFKIKKGEIQIDKQSVAKIEKEKEGFKISSLDGTSFFVALATNLTPKGKVAPKYWLVLTGNNGNIRESEYEGVGFSFSKEKWTVEALLKSGVGLIGGEGMNKEKVKQYFESSDRSVSDKWEKFIEEKLAEIEKESQLAIDQKLTIDGSGNIKKNGEKVGYYKKVTVNAQVPSYEYVVYNAKNSQIGSVFFYEAENLNNSNGGVSLEVGEEKNALYGIKFSFNKIVTDDLAKRMVYRLNAMGAFD
ncbi:hypothetical protein SAMN04488018_10638 [Myroides marinus]|uniref:Uncharacterized protein n=1 Tax=Myroides marinus TaxID=703342 RepID=A0A1H6U4S0_9FLAO|nr:hypothetical protein [Myroides marinus]SEI87293.1 hypothetical protein SAMN04488018_10638 [Myroides marinus]